MLCVNVLHLLFSAVAAHTELVRTLTTAQPAKRQPASSTGNPIQIMSLLHYITHQRQLILSQSSSNSPETSPIAICVPFVFLSVPRFYHLFSTSFVFVLYSLAFLLSILLSLPFSLSLIILLLIQYILWYERRATASDSLIRIKMNTCTFLGLKGIHSPRKLFTHQRAFCANKQINSAPKWGLFWSTPPLCVTKIINFILRSFCNLQRSALAILPSPHLISLLSSSSIM